MQNTKNMKVFFIIPSLVVGGAERIVALLAHNWSEKENSITIVTYQDQDKDFYKVQSPTKKICIYPTFFSESILKYIQIIARLRNIFIFNKDSYFISFLPKANILCLIASIGLKRRLVICERNIINDPDIDKKQDFFRRALYPFAWKISVQHEEIYNEFVLHFKKVNKEKICITPNPIREIIPNSDYLLPSLIKDKKSKTKLLAIGRFTSVKAFLDLLIIFKSALEKSSELFLTIIGDGPEFELCKKFVDDNKMNDFVYLPGKLNIVDNWLCASDVFVNTSKYEGFPNVIAEALSAGLPVIAFDAPSIKVLIKDTINGFVIPDRSISLFADKILYLVNNPIVRKKMGLEGKKFSCKYSLDSINKIWFEKVLI